MKSSAHATSPLREPQTAPNAAPWESIAGFLILRLFLALIALMNGVTKFEGKGGTYSLEAYATNMKQMAKLITDDSFIPLWMSQLFAYPLGFLLILLGLGILSGFFMRLTLAASGLLYVALTFGLLASKNSPGAAWLGIYVGLTVIALCMTHLNRFQVNRW